MADRDGRSIDAIVDTLRRTNRYQPLVRKFVNASRPSLSILFEAIFAHTFELSGCPLRYEVSVNADSSKTMDFGYPITGSPRVCFELVRPGMSSTVAARYGPHPTSTNGVTVEGIVLSGNAENEHLRPEAQTIRLQEKLLEKVGKLPEPYDDTVALVVVDCSDISLGMLDEEDCRMLMFGTTQFAPFREYWQGQPILGLLDSENSLRGAELFKQRASGVILVPELGWDLFQGSFLVLNTHRSENHRTRARLELSRLRALAPVVEVCR